MICFVQHLATPKPANQFTLHSVVSHSPRERPVSQRGNSCRALLSPVLTTNFTTGETGANIHRARESQTNRQPTKPLDKKKKKSPGPAPLSKHLLRIREAPAGPPATNIET